MKKSIFKKVIAMVLAIVMTFSLVVVSFASEDETTPVIVVSGMSARYYYNSETGESVLPASFTDILDFATGIIPTSLEALLAGDLSVFSYGISSSIFDLLEEFSCDENGVPVNEYVTTETYDEAISNYQEYFDSCILFQQALARSIGDEIGSDRTFYFNYDWRLSPLDHADDLNDMVEYVKESLGVEKVKIIALSMGGTILSSYIYKYGTDSIESMTYGATAYQGVDFAAALVTGELSLNSIDVLTYFAGLFEDNFLVADSLNSLSSTLSSSEFLQSSVDSVLDWLMQEFKDPLYEEAISQAFGSMYGIWALVPEEDYEAAKEYISSLVDLSDEFFEKADEYIYEVQANANEMLIEAQESGIPVYFIGSYGFSGVPISDATSSQADVLIETENMLSGCIVAPYGETLGYEDETNIHISTDNIIDATNSAFADTTWVIKSTTHVAFRYDSVVGDLVTWVATADEPIDIYSNELYPQFVQYNALTNTFSSLTQGVVLEGDTLEVDDSFISKLMTLIQNIPSTIKDLFSLYILFFK